MSAAVVVADVVVAVVLVLAGRSTASGSVASEPLVPVDVVVLPLDEPAVSVEVVLPDELLESVVEPLFDGVSLLEPLEEVLGVLSELEVVSPPL
jgi:hypothetical protein